MSRSGTPTIDESTDIGARAAERLRSSRVIWLTTVSGQGVPQSSPVWYDWDGGDFSVYSLESPRHENITRNPAVGLHLAGAEVTLRGRAIDRTRRTAETVAVAWCRPENSAPSGSILVNATPLGCEPGQDGPFAEAEIESAASVVDMVYGEHETQLVSRARDLGIPAADGREVLLHQGIAQRGVTCNRRNRAVFVHDVMDVQQQAAAEAAARV